MQDTNDCVPEMMTELKPHRPIPYAVLKVQFRRLVSQHDTNHQGAILTKNLLVLIDDYELENDVMLLTDEQKRAIEPYCLNNPDLEMNPDDILNLIKLIFPPSPVASISAPTRKSSYPRLLPRKSQEALSSRPRTSPPLKHPIINPWKRRASVGLTIAVHQEVPEPEMEIEGPKEQNSLVPVQESEDQSIEVVHDTDKIQEEEEEEEEEEETIVTPQKSFAGYYRRSIELTRRLKSSERSLASMTRDNEDRIVLLQNRVDDMNQEVIKQKREILEYKGKEKNSLEQICTLESHIANIQRSETDQKQVHLSIKRLFDEKCQETHKLQEMLRQKELDLEKTEQFLSNFQHEFDQLNKERNRLMGLQNNLEQELSTSHQTHMQLAEQRSENERLKEIIDSLKDDLDEARNNRQGDSSNSNSTIGSHSPHMSDSETTSLLKTLEAELEGRLHMNENVEQVTFTEERLRSIEGEKDYYKTRANEAVVDLEKAKEELSQLKKALDYESQSLVSELADLRMKLPDRRNTTDGSHAHSINYDSSPISSDTQQTGLNQEAIAAAAAAVETQGVEIEVEGGESSMEAVIDLSQVMDPIPSVSHSAVVSIRSVDETAIEMNIPLPTDVWAQSRVRQRKLEKGKKTRGVQDLNESTAYPVKTLPRMDSRAIRQANDKIVTNTVTFALYTLLVYIFGIVTSTFLIENGPPGTWEHALAAASTQPKSKILEILIYWIEKLLFEGEGIGIP
ncbi:hypothetical protein J3Q64DRAFT_1732550 [Phycomyces blakesleeanus]|uniref:Uncharacterized protein n=1 Tax=Phycomyces blakesleeanus TaxID=4837 RepID=A0ABR3B3I7_PHYBL